MKKAYRLILVMFLLVLVMGGCKNSYADISENIKSVYASYYLNEIDTDKEDRLSKIAELCYVKMNITPNSNLTVTGVSFKAKLKNSSNESFKLKIYITNQDKLLNPNFNDFELYSAYDINLTNTEQEFTINFPQTYSFNVSQLDNISKIDNLCIEFLKDGVKNTDTFFSLNNIELLT